MSTHNNSGFGDGTDTTKKAGNDMEGTPDTKPTHGDDKKMGGNSQSGSNGDTSRN